MPTQDKKIKPGAKKGENRFKEYQENRKLKKILAIKEVLRKAKSLRVSFKSFSHLADFVVSELELSDDEFGKKAISKSSLYRTPDYRFLIGEYLKYSDVSFDEASKLDQGLKDFSLMLKVKMLEAENLRLKLYIEKKLSLEGEGGNDSFMLARDDVGQGGGDIDMNYKNGGDLGVGLEGELDAVGKLCSLIEAMVYKSECFYEVKGGVVVTSAYGAEDELVGDMDIQHPFKEWFLGRYDSE